MALFSMIRFYWGVKGCNKRPGRSADHAGLTAAAHISTAAAHSTANAIARPDARRSNQLMPALKLVLMTAPAGMRLDDRRHHTDEGLRRTRARAHH